MRQIPEIILQSCVFEWITQKIEEVKIPAYVFEAFGMEPEDRTFRLADTLFIDESSGSKKEMILGKMAKFLICPVRKRNVVLLSGDPLY